MTDDYARDSASAVMLANASLMSELLRAFVGRGVLTHDRILSLLTEVQKSLVETRTNPGAMAAGHVEYIRDLYQKRQP